MKSTRSFATTSFAGILLAVMTAPGVAPSLAPIEREVASGYQCALRAYDKALTWSVIARWWIDPQYSPSVQPPERVEDDVCQLRSAGGREQEAR
jgi:hypothetical protein